MVLNILREHFDLGESEFCNSTDSERPTEDAKRENNQFRSTTYMGSGAIPVPQEAPLAGFATGGGEQMPEAIHESISKTSQERPAAFPRTRLSK